MSEKNYTFEDVNRVLHELAAERPDYVYEKPENPDGTGDSCVYSTPDGQPSCIIGHVIARLDPDEFKTIHNMEWRKNKGDSCGVVNLAWSDQFTGEQVSALNVAQGAQDAGEQWRDAVASFDALLEES